MHQTIEKMKGNIKSMRFYLLIFSFFIQLNIYCLNNRDTLFMSKNHFRYDRDYGLGFKYNTTLALQIRIILE